MVDCVRVRKASKQLRMRIIDLRPWDTLIINFGNVKHRSFNYTLEVGLTVAREARANF